MRCLLGCSLVTTVQAPTLRCVQVRRVPLRRVKELNELKGPRYLMSLLLELADLAAPALRTMWRNASGGSV